METGIVHYIDTPRGTIEFNDYADPLGTFRTAAIENADGGNLRADVEDYPQRDGARVGDGFEGAMYPLFRVQIDPKGDLTRRRVMEDEIKAKLASIKRANGTWRYTPRGATERQMTVRLFEKPVITGGPIVKEVVFALVVGNPTQESSTLETVDSSLLSSGLLAGTWTLGSGATWTLGTGGGGPAWSLGTGTAGGAVTVTNDGNSDAYPIVRVHGSVTAPKIHNLTTGLSLELPGLSLGPGEYAEVNMLDESIFLNGDPTQPLLGTSDPQADFFPLAPGTNTLALEAGLYDATAKLTVVFRDSWE